MGQTNSSDVIGDTERLRFLDESASVVRKALKVSPPSAPQYLPLSIDLQARSIFFTYYATNRRWGCLVPYNHPVDSPKHLTLTIEALSLAYLWRRVNSAVTLVFAREKYVQALRMTNKALKNSKEATQNTTLMASLLLDVFEKITNVESGNKTSWAVCAFFMLHSKFL